MNEKNTYTISGAIVIIIIAISFFGMIAYIYSPTEFVFTFNINHTADDNTKALYDAFGQGIEREINQTSCIAGCKLMFDEFSSDINTVSIDGFYKSDCWRLCE